MKRALMLATGVAVTVVALEGLPCEGAPANPSFEIMGAPSSLPANAAVLFWSSPGDLEVEVEGDSADTVPANFPGLSSLFIDPLPEPGDKVTIEATGCGHCTYDNTAELTAGDHDLTPPLLQSPIYLPHQGFRDKR